MLNIEDSLFDFTQSLLLGKSVSLDAQGYWKIEQKWKKTCRQFLGREPARFVEMAQVFLGLLDRLEATPIRFSRSLNAAEQQKRFDLYIRASEAILAHLSLFKAPFCLSTCQQLSLRLAALKYRLEAINGGWNQDAPSHSLQNKLEEQAVRWKLTLDLVSERHLTDKQKRIIEELSRFPVVAHMLLENQSDLDDFFRWALRDELSVRIFVEFPATARMLIVSGLNGRMSRIGANRGLKLGRIACHSNEEEKIVTLPFEGNDVNILDDQRLIKFQTGYELTLKEIYEIFRDKNKRVGNIEFMSEGIINWNVQKWGRCAKTGEMEVVGVAKDRWWEDLPVFEELSHQQARERYELGLDGVQWVVAAAATRERPTLDVDLTHAFLEVAVPVEGERYRVFSFGKVANEFPASYLDMLRMVCTTVPATIAFPDDNVFYTHREHSLQAFVLSPAEGKLLMRSIKKDMISARGFNFVYQVESENCAKWVHEKIEDATISRVVPNMFVMSIFHTEAASFLGSLIRFCKLFPFSWQMKILGFFHLPLGAGKGRWVLENGTLIWRALTHHSFWTTGTIYLPCLLHRQKELGHLELTERFLDRSTEALWKNKVAVSESASRIQAAKHFCNLNREILAATGRNCRLLLVKGIRLLLTSRSIRVFPDLLARYSHVSSVPGHQKNRSLALLR